LTPAQKFLKINQLAIDKVDQIIEDIIILKNSLFVSEKDSWNVLAAFVSTEGEVLSMATGLKCLPHTLLHDENGNRSPNYHKLVRDSHAEVLARRSLIRYLLLEKKRAINEVWLFTSCVPCGDASIPTPLGQECTLNCGFERGKNDWSKLGVLRTKPARGDAPITYSMSCSDKILLWQHLGVQGKYLPNRVALKGIIVFGVCELEASIHRAFINRFNIDKERGDDFLIINSSTAPLYDELLPPSPLAQVWYKGMERIETLVLGRKQGSSSQITPKSSSLFCDFSLFNLANGYQNNDYQIEKEEFFKESKIFSHWPFRKQTNASQ
jgi:hypothetical protein